MVGQNIGKYRVLDRIGRGGMGTVYRAIDETLHRDVAIKVLNAELNDPEVAKRFRAEAITVARLSHPGIATIYELFQHEGQWLMVMEFVRGETLEHMVERMGPLSAQRAAELCMQTLAALAHAHSMGVVHRDLKPANLMITETGAIKIMDFGIARVSGTEHLTSAGFMMGTPAYMAPEQVMGREIDARADLYALGVVFYRLTTAKLPFKGETPFAMAQSQVHDPPTPIGTYRSDLPPWAESVVARSLAKSPEERFQSAIEFHEAFARCLAGLPMTSTYSSSAPTELMMTPPRAMPTGAIYRTPTPTPASYPSPMPAPMATGSVPVGPVDPGMAPTMLSGSQGNPTATGPQAASGDLHAVVTPPATSTTAAQGSSTGAVVTPSTTSGAVPVVTATTSGATPAPTMPPQPAPTGAMPAAVSTTGATAAAGTTSAVSSTATSAVPPPAEAAAVAGAAKASAPPQKTSSTSVAAIVVLVILLLAAGGGGAWWWRAHRVAATTTAAVTEPAPAPAPPTDPSAAPAAPAPDAATTPGDAASTAVTSPTTSAASTPGDAGARGGAVPPATSTSSSRAGTTPSATGAPGATPASRGATPTDPAAAAAAAANAGRAGARGDTGRATAPAAPTFEDTHEVFQDIKLLVVNGRRGQDRDVILSFGNGQVSLQSGGGGNALATVPYKSITHLTYVHARDPRWQDTDNAPPKDLDVGSFMRTAKHWLVVQASDRYVILRLEDKNIRAVLDTFATRTGLTINRPQTNEK